MSNITRIMENNKTFGFPNFNDFGQNWSPTLKSIAKRALIVSLPIIATAVALNSIPTAEGAINNSGPLVDYGTATYASCVAGCMGMPIGPFRAGCLLACLPFLAPNLP